MGGPPRFGHSVNKMGGAPGEVVELVGDAAGDGVAGHGEDLGHFVVEVGNKGGVIYLFFYFNGLHAEIGGCP